MTSRMALLGLALTSLLGGRVAAQETRRPIQDNSFLVEEAYNQEPGVVQHISTLQRSPSSWTYSFTQEWPVGGIRNQLSYSIPVSSADGSTGLGDIALNYRRQVVGTGETRLAVAPRFTVLLPTGSEASGRGAGGVGVQVLLPASYSLSRALVSHWNLGATITPRAHGPGDGAVATTSVNAGASLIWLARPWMNLMLEGIWSRAESAVAAGLTRTGTSWFVSPGVRWAIDSPGGLQVVPGIAYMIGLGPSGGEGALFGYLSFEHAFRSH